MSDLLELRRDLILGALSDPYLELNTVEVAELIGELAEIDDALDFDPTRCEDVGTPPVSDWQDARNSREFPY
jgi:hypothetical protein